MSSVHHLNQPVVLDLGSGLTKAGYAGTPDPTHVIGSLVGHPKLPKILPTSTSTPTLPDSHPATRESYLPQSSTTTASTSNCVVGDQLHTLSGILRLQYPLHNGAVQDWTAAEDLWRHVINDLLSVDHGEHPFLITEAALNPRSNRHRLAQFFFETCNVPSLYITPPALLSLYASGRTTGMVLDVGDTTSTALPIIEGHCDVHAIRRIDLAGRHVTDRLTTLLRKSGTALFASSSEQQAVRRLKERLAYVAVDPRAAEINVANDDASTAISHFELPDGNVVSVGAERFRAPEILFRPDIIAREHGGVHHLIRESVDAVDIELRKRLYSSVLLAGGCTKFRGFGHRLLSELRQVAPNNTKLRIHAPPDRLYSAFTGGSILASLSTTFKSLAVSRAEYYENGASIVHQKAL